MSYQHVHSAGTAQNDWSAEDRRALVGWMALGLGVFAALTVVTFTGFYTIYQLLFGEILTSKISIWWVVYLNGSYTGAVVASIGVSIPLALWLLMILQVLFITLDPPEGIVLGAGDAPDLFRLIERIAGGHNANRPDAVVIDTDCNAGIVQRPALGIAGPMKTSLVIGLPLLDAIDMRELPALLGHELGHLHDDVGTLETAARRTGILWQRIETCCAEGWVPFGRLLATFSSWYLERLNAMLLRNSRCRELAADASAATGQGIEASVSVMVRFAVASLWFEKMWEMFPARIRRHAEPRFKPFQVAPRWFRKLDDRARFEKLLRVAMVQATSHRDTHPAWHDRIAALGPGYRIPPPVEHPASEILGAAEAQLRNDMHDAWCAQVQDCWTAEHEQAEEEVAHLENLERAAAAGEISPEDDRTRAHLTRELRGVKPATDLFRLLVERNPDDAELQFSLGQVLLAQQDDEGLPFLDKARALDPGLAPAVIVLASEHLASIGEVDRARALCADIDTALDELDRAADERSEIRKGDVFEQHGLDGIAAERLRERVAGIPSVRRAWLVRKRVERLQTSPCLVLLIEYSRLRSMTGTADAAHYRLMDACADLPLDMFFVRKSLGNISLSRKIDAVPNAILFDRTQPEHGAEPDAV